VQGRIWRSSTSTRIPLRRLLLLAAFASMFVGVSAVAAFAQDDVPPPGTDVTDPQTILAKSPPKNTHKRSATFSFTSDDPTARFVCKVDSQTASPCTSPKSYSGLTRRRHNFIVQAIDPSDNEDPTPIRYTWRIWPKSHKLPH
jgi:hypothetical protein